MNNPHQILGVPENATIEEIEEQYRLLSEAQRSGTSIADGEKTEYTGRCRYHDWENN